MPYKLVFDGVNDYLDVPSTAGISTQFEYEFRCSLLSGYGRVCGSATNSTSDRILIWPDGSKIRFDSDSNISLSMSGVTVTDLNTYKITGDGSNLRLYVNDALQDTQAYTGSCTSISVIGANGNSYHDGDFEFFRFTDNQDSTQSRHYELDDGSGSVAADSSGNSQNADLINFPTDDSQWVSLGGGASTITGSGSPQAATATASGSGIREVTGSGTPQAATATASGAGTVSGTITGSGTPQADTATASGTGARVVTGSGTPQADTATATGSGTVGNVVTGSGAVQADTATASGTGSRVVTGTGTLQADTGTASGTGARVVTGSGTPGADTATTTGTGARVITGTGAVAANDATASGSDTAVPDKTFGLTSMISDRGLGITSMIEGSQGVSGPTESHGLGVTSTIDPTGIGIASGF